MTWKEIEEALGPQNLYYASLWHHREPTALEAISYYMNHKPKVRTFDVVPNLFTQTGMGNDD